jgi:hypothetical protein
MLLWIAPFYGFFHAPWFLAQSLAIPCEGRPSAQSAIAAAAMLLATLAGQQLGLWMFPGPAEPSCGLMDVKARICASWHI